MIAPAGACGARAHGGGSRPVVVAIMGHYLPGWKGGGHIITGALAIDQLGGEFDFKVFCLDHDLAESTPYPGVKSGVWQAVGKAEVCYLTEARLDTWWRQAAARRLRYDLLWIHGLFKTATVTTLVYKRLGGLPPAPAVIVPHGELSAGALSTKPRKKAAYLRLAQLSGLYRGFWWQTSSAYEAREVSRVFAGVPDDRIRIVRNPAVPAMAAAGRRPKKPGTLRLIFLSRISRKKNLDVALRLLARVAGDIEFDVFGPMEDAAYWAECQSTIARLPAGTRVIYRGPLKPAAVIPTLASYHALFLPSRGENFGYVILEALQAGCPPLISDATPWKDLERTGAGWDLPLSDPDRFVAALERLLAMDTAEFARWSDAAANLGRTVASAPGPADDLRALFRDALRPGPAS